MPERAVSEAVCEDRYRSLNRAATAAESSASAAHRRIDGLVGIDGGKGRVGMLEADMENVAKILERVAASQQQTAIKLAVMCAAASAVGGFVFLFFAVIGVELLA